MQALSWQSVEKGLASARTFVWAHGNPLECVRLEVLLGNRPSASLDEALVSREQASTTDPCVALEVLEVLGDAGCLRGPLAGRVAESVRGKQRPDGSWRAPGRVAEPDPALTGLPIGPRDPLFLTSMLGALIGRSARGSASTLDSASAYLAAHWSPDLVQSGSWWAIAGFAHFFSNVPHELSDPVLQWCGRELERAFRTGSHDAVRAARVFTLCDAQALPGARLDADELVPALLQSQKADGGWPAASIPARVAATFDAALALVRFGRATPRRAAP